METKANYALVGIFVIISSLIGIAIILWIIGGTSSKKYDTYMIQTKQSVSGLHKDSNVKYKGVSVGKVERISIDKDNLEYIQIYIKVEKDLPITIDTKAQISTNGLTGLSYVNLIGGKNRSKLLRNTSKEKYPKIPAVPSTMEKLSNSAEKAMRSINKLAENLDRIIKNNESNINIITNQLKQTSIQMKKLILHSDALVLNAKNTNKEIKKTVTNINKLTQNLNKMVTENSNSIKYLTHNSFENFNNLVTETKHTIREIKSFVIELKENPSTVIKGKKLKKGPGE